MLWARRAAAIEAIGALVAACGGGRLSKNAVKQYRGGEFDVAWRLWVDLSRSRFEFHLLVDDDFPYSPPRVAMPDIRPLTWPHLEKDGLLCLLPPDAAVSVEDPASVAKEVLADACRLVQECVRGCNVEDFRQEFLSYWEIAADQDSCSVVSIVEPKAPSRAIWLSRGTHTLFAGDSEDSLAAWMRHRGIRMERGEVAFEEGVLLWLREPLLPKEYPSTAADVRVLAEDHADVGQPVLANLAVRAASRMHLLLGADTPNGVCFAALSLGRAGRARFGGARDPMSKGFRPGHLDRRVSLDRYLAPTQKVQRRVVQRADHQWIHGRDRDVKQHVLRNAKVAVLGCGSLGAPVARLLAQAGVGNLLLVDPALMDWRNVGRHTLAAPSVEKHKADELAKQIKRDYPHLASIRSFPCRVGPAARHIVEELERCTLIVSTMGNWSAESFLNELQRWNTAMPTIVFAWLEDRALAAHAVVVIQQHAACLRCGVDHVGKPNLHAIDWAKQAQPQAPACGATFSPYGPAELCWAHALAAETTMDTLLDTPAHATHRMWLGQTKRIHQAGGHWSAGILREVGDVGRGGFTIDRPWSASPTCSVCGTDEG